MARELHTSDPAFPSSSACVDGILGRLSASKNSILKNNQDIEELLCPKKRKMSGDNVVQRKKLHLSKCRTLTTPQVPDCQKLETCNRTSSCETHYESKENCSDNVNVVKLIKRTCNQSSLDDFLQMIHKPKTFNSTSKNNTSCSSDDKILEENIHEEYEVTKSHTKPRNTEETHNNIAHSEELKLDVSGNYSCDVPGTVKIISNLEDLSESSRDIESSTENKSSPEKLDTSPQKLNNEFDGLFDDLDLEEAFSAENTDLDLSKWQRCEVLQVNEDLPSRNIILQLRSLNTNAVIKFVLQGVWTSSNISPGSIVCVKGYYETSLSAWTVDNNEGLFIEFPDILISPTTIVGSLSCLRQGVLNYLFSKSAYNSDECSKLLVTGSLVHELLQQIMSQGTDSPECIAALVEEIISSSNNVRLLYSNKMSLHEARQELLKVVPNIQKFCKRYSFGEQVVGNTGKDLVSSSIVEKDAWEGEIHSVVAVEDNYWIPELGLKGKVDVTVTAKEKGQLQNQLMPIELKTGAAKNSVEHRGQVILYCLMARQVSPEVGGGLLVYTREGFARKVEVGRPEQRDIITLRNRVAQYIAPFFSFRQETKNKKFPLPRPTNNSRVCEWCPQKIVCSTFLSASKEELTKTSAQDIRTASIEHLTPEHLDYVVHWSNLLWLEEKDKPRDTLTDLWTISAEKREIKGRCLCNLELNGPVRFKDVDSYSHVFKWNSERKFDFNCNPFSSGSLVLVSTHRRIAIAFGVIEEFNDSSVSVNIPRDLSQVSNLYGELYMIDVYEPQSYLHWVLGNLAALLDDVEAAANLRRLLISCDLPVFDSTCEYSFELNNKSQFILNGSQQNAIKMAFAAKDYLLLRGLPGSGKSTTIAVLIQQLVSGGHSVLLTAQTHSAVDTVLLKLLKLDVPFLRIGSKFRVHEAIHPWTEYNLTKHCRTPEQLEETYNKQTVVAATCLGVRHAMFTRRSFDICIVDESTQILQPVILGPLLNAKKFILVGDPEQLPPVVRSAVASKNGLSKCMFTHLAKPEATVSLDLQYRMNSKITDLANDLTYGGKLKCASLVVAEATLQRTSKEIQDSLPSWQSKALSCKIEDSVVFLDIPKTQDKVSDCINKEEALVVKKLVELFIQAGVNSNAIGVIAPYRNQVKYITSIMKSIPNIETNTVDQYQGRDKDVVILSCTNNWSSNNTSNSDSSILNDKRRLTVAITRAKYKLVIIGSLLALQCFTPLKHIINSIGNLNTVKVPDC